MIDDICIGFKNSCLSDSELDRHGKVNNITIVKTNHNNETDYRMFTTGTLLSRNDKYPSGLVILDNNGKPNKFE